MLNILINIASLRMIKQNTGAFKRVNKSRSPVTKQHCLYGQFQ